MNIIEKNILTEYKIFGLSLFFINARLCHIDTWIKKGIKSFISNLTFLHMSLNNFLKLKTIYLLLIVNSAHSIFHI